MRIWPFPGERLQAGRCVHDVSDDRVVHPVDRTHVSRNDVAGVDADADLNSSRDRRPRASWFYLVHVALHLDGGDDRPFGVVVMRYRRPEHRHHAIAYVLVERSFVLEHHVCETRKVGVEQVDHLLGPHPFRHRGEPSDVREERRHLSALPAEPYLLRIREDPVHELMGNVAGEGVPKVRELRVLDAITIWLQIILIDSKIFSL